MFKDIQVLHAQDVHCLGVVSVVTAQNSNGVVEVSPVSDALFQAQLDALIAEFRIDVLKLGLLGSINQVKLVKARINPEIPLVFDPVMSSTSGGQFLDKNLLREAVQILRDRITLFTPNLGEAAAISGLEIHSTNGMLTAAREFHQLGVKNVLIKGGHGAFDVDDCYNLFSGENDTFWIVNSRIEDGENTRGTGCAFASSCAAALAMGHDVRDAVVISQEIVSRGINSAKQLGNMKIMPTIAFPSKMENFPRVRYGRSPSREKYEFSRCETNQLGIYPVVDSLDWVRNLIDLGVQTIQLRIKDRDEQEIFQEITEAVQISSSAGVRLFVNDYWDIAIEVGAYGVHLGQEDLRTANLSKIASTGLRLGISTHSFWEVAAAMEIDPSYIAIGPVFSTTSKPMAFEPQGIDKVKFWVEFFQDRWPLVAIGGIDLERSKLLKKTGVGSVAMISAITQANDYKQATKDLLRTWSA